MNDENIEDKLIEVPESEFMLSMNDALQAYEMKKKTITEAQKNIMNLIANIHLYQDLNFRVKYFYDETHKQYTFSYETKPTIGFK